MEPPSDPSLSNESLISSSIVDSNKPSPLSFSTPPLMPSTTTTSTSTMTPSTPTSSSSADATARPRPPLLSSVSSSVPFANRARSKTPRLLSPMAQQQQKPTLTSDEESLIMDEFDTMKSALHAQKQKIYEGSFAPENRSKNRYRDVLPFEETRVKLEPVAGDAHSDYINANIIHGEVSHALADSRAASAQHYICCQAPLPNTIYDFWRMVVQFRVPVVVMLTKLEEKSRTKAHAYWPHSVGESQRFADIMVTLKLQKCLMENIILRVIEVRRHTPDGAFSEPHQLSHLHYTEWPDFGIPESTEVMRELIKELDIRKTSPQNPIVVHCSAGIGRAGTFLAIHIALQKHLTCPHHPLSIRDTVLKLRQQRHGMVQSKDQYKFVYATLKEALHDRSAAPFLPSAADSKQGLSSSSSSSASTSSTSSSSSPSSSSTTPTTSTTTASLSSSSSSYTPSLLYTSPSPRD